MRQNLPEKRRRDWNTGERLTERKKGTNSMIIAQSARRGREKTSSYKRNDLYRGEVTQKCRPYW
jgi:hypothetical protein